MAHQLVLVLDFGSQYTQLIARRIREQSRLLRDPSVHARATDLAKIRALNPIGIVLSGGPNSVYDDGAPTIPAGLYELGIPVLGICYGAQLTAQLLGGKVRPADKREYGRATVRVKHGDEGVFKHGRRGRRARGVGVARRSRRCDSAGLRAHRRVRELRDERLRERRAQDPLRPVPPRGRPHRRAAPSCSATSCSASATRRATGRWRRSSTKRSRAIRAQVGDDGSRDLRPVGRRRFVGRRGADPPRDRRSAHLHLRRQRPAAQRRARAGRGDLPRSLPRRPRA